MKPYRKLTPIISQGVVPEDIPGLYRVILVPSPAGAESEPRAALGPRRTAWVRCGARGCDDAGVLELAAAAAFQLRCAPDSCAASSSCAV